MKVGTKCWYPRYIRVLPDTCNSYFYVPWKGEVVKEEKINGKSYFKMDDINCLYIKNHLFKTKKDCLDYIIKDYLRGIKEVLKEKRNESVDTIDNLESVNKKNIFTLFKELLTINNP